jgi:predicted ester cyclase
VGRWLFEGAWRGGRPPGATAAPGTRVRFHGHDILRVEGGHIAEYWLCDDLLDVYAQLGAQPGLPPAHAAPA